MTALAPLPRPRQHPDVRPPAKKELRFWRPVAAPHAHLRSRPERQLQVYSDLFPLIDPRDFQVTGEASPAYLYSLPALRFFLQPNMRMARLILLLRDPAARAASEFLHKREESKPEWTGPDALPVLARKAVAFAASCGGVDALYAACVPCARFLRDDATQNVRTSPHAPAVVERQRRRRHHRVAARARAPRAARAP